MTKEDKKILFYLNKRMVDLWREANRLELIPGNEEAVNELNKQYDITLKKTIEYQNKMENLNAVMELFTK